MLASSQILILKQLFYLSHLAGIVNVLTHNTCTCPITVMHAFACSQGVTNSQKRCTDFKNFGFHLKISLIFHKILLAKSWTLPTLFWHYTLLNNTIFLLLYACCTYSLLFYVYVVCTYSYVLYACCTYSLLLCCSYVLFVFIAVVVRMFVLARKNGCGRLSD